MECVLCGRVLKGACGIGESVMCEKCAAEKFDGRTTNKNYYEISELGDMLLGHVDQLKTYIKTSINHHKHTRNNHKIIVRDITISVSSIFAKITADTARLLKELDWEE